MADSGDIQVVIQKISGETVETTARAEDSVGDIKSRVAPDAQVPAICQRLVLHNVSKRLIFERSMPHLTQQLENILERIEKNMYTEVRAMARPPRLCFTSVVMILQLLAASPKALSFGQLSLKKTKFADCSWRECNTMLGDYMSFRENLRCIVASAVSGELEERKVKLARSTWEELGGDTASKSLSTVSALCSVLCSFAAEVLKIHQEAQQSIAPHVGAALGSVELHDMAPLSVYCSETLSSEGALHLALLADLEPAFQAIDSGGREARLEAVLALGALGEKCPERSIPALCQCWRGWHTAEAAFQSLKRICSPGPEVLSMFLTASPHFYGHEFGVKAALYLGSDSPQVFASIVTGIEQNSSFCLDAFKELLPAADLPQTIQLLLGGSLFKDRSGSSVDCLGQALALVNERDHAGLMEGLLAYLDPTQPAWVLARASAWAAELAQGEEETLVQALLVALGHVSGDDLLKVAQSLVRISEGSRLQALEALCAELKKDATSCRFREVVLEETRQLAVPDEVQVLKPLLSFIEKAEPILKTADSNWAPVTGTMKLLDQLDQTSRSFFQKAIRHLTRILARLCLAAPMWWERPRAPERLVRLARDHGGAEHETLVQLCEGFKCQNDLLRHQCRRTFAAIPKKAPELANLLLLGLIKSEEFSWTKEAAMRALDLSAKGLEGLEPDQKEDIKASLLQAAEEPFLRCLALSLLMPFANDEGVRNAALKYSEESDVYVQREALRVLAEDVIPFDCLARSLQSQERDNVLLGLEALARSELSSEYSEYRQQELSALLAPLLTHRSEEVALSAAQALGRMTGEGKSSAAAALRPRGIWPETRPAVLQARREALQSLV